MSIVGIIGKVIGGTQYFYEDGTAHAVTAIEAGPCTITQIKSLKKDGYQSVQLGFEKIKKSNKPKKGHLAVAGGDLFRHLREIRSEDYEGLELGSQIDVGMFEVGGKVNVTGVSKGKGFQGGVKRYNWSWNYPWTCHQRNENGRSYGWRQNHCEEFGCRNGGC